MTKIQENFEVTKKINTTELTAKDFKTPLDVRWCAGCGDYSVLAQLQKLFPTLGIPKENFVVVSGIGCSSRFPYYVDVYGFHTMHGRALPVASGIKIANPDLSVWVITGDGDGMAIGGNHFIHAIRRNMDIKVLLLNNEIYSMTKGQYSPTSPQGLKTKSSPFGVIDYPFNPVALSLGSGATFVARTSYSNPKHLSYVLKRASEHKGIAFVEIYSNCVIFTDGIFDQWTDKNYMDENAIFIEDNQPLIFGKNKDKGIIIENFAPKIVDLNDPNVNRENLIVHNEKNQAIAQMIGSMSYDNDLPRPFGVFLDIEKPSYDFLINKQISDIVEKHGTGNIDELLKGSESWEIK
jgi:2-oxoglutarate ferredoxin oxidoreductase subunit beta